MSLIITITDQAGVPAGVPVKPLMLKQGHMGLVLLHRLSSNTVRLRAQCKPICQHYFSLSAPTFTGTHIHLHFGLKQAKIHIQCCMSLHLLLMFLMTLLSVVLWVTSCSVSPIITGLTLMLCFIVSINSVALLQQTPFTTCFLAQSIYNYLDIL